MMLQALLERAPGNVATVQMGETARCVQACDLHIAYDNGRASDLYALRDVSVRPAHAGGMTHQY